LVGFLISVSQRRGFGQRRSEAASPTGPIRRWRHRRLQDISRRDIRMLVDQKAETAPIMANRILARVSRLFSFAVERDWIEANPGLRIVKPADEKGRDRVVSRDELRELWTALHETEAKDANGKALPRLSQTLNDAFIVMLLTA
jgi:site-specific recombinase XerD